MQSIKIAVLGDDAEDGAGLADLLTAYVVFCFRARPLAGTTAYLVFIGCTVHLIV